jgi:cell wall-associated NlpC family hydrolase
VNKGDLVGFAMRRAGSVAVILLASCLITSAASAASAPDKQAQAQQLAQQLDAQGRQISILDEQFNQARLKSDQLDQEVADINARLVASDRQLAAARQRLGLTSVDAYVHSGSAPLLAALIHAKGSDLGVRRTYIDAALSGQRRALAGFEAARARLLALRDQLRATQRSVRANANAIDANRRAADGAIAAQQQTATKAQGDMAPLVAAAAAQQAAAQEQRMRARFLTAAPPAATAAKPTPTTVAPPKKLTPTTAAPSGSGSVHTTTTVSHPTSPPTTAKPAPAPSGPSGTPPPVSSGAATAVSTAKAQLGKPYVYGGAGPDSFDCSGLTMYAWHAAGVSLPHSAEMQRESIPAVAISQLQPGDLVFFGSPAYHVGIYVGSGQMIDAPHTGANVEYDSIYWNDLSGAGRP